MIGVAREANAAVAAAELAAQAAVVDCVIGHAALLRWRRG